MGTPEFALPSLKSLIESPDKILAIITQPDRPRGRGQKPQPSPVKEIGESCGIPVQTFDSLKTSQAQQFLNSFSPDLIVVVAYGKLLPEAILSIPRYGCINAHASLLPQYRGAAPIQRALMQGVKETGVTIFKLIQALDAGPILWKEAISVGANETFGSLHDRLANLSAKGLIATCEMLKSGSANPALQDDNLATFAPKLHPEEELIEWGATAETIHNYIRALDPFPGAYTTFKGKRLKVFGSRVMATRGTGTPGAIVEIKSDGAVIQTGSGKILLTEVQPENKKRMTAQDFAHGVRLSTTDQLGT